ncbi:MAG: ATP synthase subunit F [Clostridiales bacterium]|nr:ATP synthase subunit F [Clostridiales bacterium]
MKMYLISDNTETYEGLRLAGVEGIVVHDGASVVNTLKNTAADDGYGIILVTEKAYSYASEEIDQFMAAHTRPLITRIPDRHGSVSKSESITDFIKTGIGLDLG